MEFRCGRRRLLGAAAALLCAPAAAACGPAPPGKTRLEISGELVPSYLLQTPYGSTQPAVAMSFAPWPPAPAASASALDGMRFAEAAVRQALLPLDGRLSLVAFSPQGIAAGAWAAFSAGGQQFGVPMVQSRLAFVYDADALAAPARDWAVADCAAALQGVAASGRTALADLSGMRVDIWAALTAARGGGGLSGPGGSLPLPAPEAAVGAWIDFASLAAHAAAGAVLSARGAAAAFAFFLLPSGVRSLQAAGLKVGVARFPGAAVPARAWGHGIAAAAPEPGAALQFLTWSAEAGCQRTLLLDGYVPVVEALATGLPPLGAAGGADPGALLPDAAADSFLPHPFRLSAAAQAAFESALAAARPGMSAAEAADAYEAAAAAAAGS